MIPLRHAGTTSDGYVLVVLLRRDDIGQIIKA